MEKSTACLAWHLLKCSAGDTVPSADKTNEKMQNKPRVDEGKKWLIQWESEAVRVHKHSIQTKFRSTVSSQAKTCCSQNFKWERIFQKRSSAWINEVRQQRIYLNTCRRQDKEPRGGRGSLWHSKEAGQSRFPDNPQVLSLSLSWQQCLGHSFSPKSSEVSNLGSDCPQPATANYRDHSRHSLTYATIFFFLLSCL